MSIAAARRSPSLRRKSASTPPRNSHHTMVANHSTLAWDLYVIYAGKNPDSGLPDHQGLP